MVCISYFIYNGMHDIPKKGVLSVRRSYTPKRYVIHTIVLTVCVCMRVHACERVLLMLFNAGNMRVERVSHAF